MLPRVCFFFPDTVSACDKCPFTSDSATVMGAHKEQHLSRPGAIFKCYFCPFYVSLKRFVNLCICNMQMCVGQSEFGVK
jgi:hypothetical protein